MRKKNRRLLNLSYIGKSAAGIGNSVRTTIPDRNSGANGGWRIALIFCFFFIKEKENSFWKLFTKSIRRNKLVGKA